MANFTSADIMRLKEQTGVGMLDCKKALEEKNGDFEAAVKFLREKGMATAAKKGSRVAAEGIVDSYIHMGGKIGVLIEVNCETDFVAKTDAFKELVHNLAMQIAAAKPEFVSKEDVSQSKIETEREILTNQAKNEPKPKPDAVIAKMVDGRIQKFYKDVCLLEQEYVKDPSITITDLINQAIQKTGEKISVRRFVRYEMGEGIAKKEDTFVSEVMGHLETLQNQPAKK